MKRANQCFWLIIATVFPGAVVFDTVHYTHENFCQNLAIFRDIVTLIFLKRVIIDYNS